MPQSALRPEPLVPVAELRVRLAQLRKDMSLKDASQILKVPLTSMVSSTTFCVYEYPVVMLLRSGSGEEPEYRLRVYSQIDAHWKEKLQEAVLTTRAGESESWPK